MTSARSDRAGRGSFGRPVSPERVLAVVGLGTFMVFLDTTIVNVAFPDILADFRGTELDVLSWVLNAYNVVLAAFFVVYGRFADALGRRRTYLAGIAIFTLASVACAVAPSVAALIAARVVQGLGGAMIVPAALALVLRAFPEARRAHAVGLFGATAALAAGLGPSIGGLLVDASGWRLTFLVNAPVGVAAFVVARLTLVESRAAGRRALPDLLGSTLLATAIGALALGIVKGGDWGWTSLEVAACATVTLLAGATVVRRSRHHRAPVLDLAVLRSRDAALANGLTVTAAVALFAAMLCNILFLTTVWGYSELEAGLAITPGPLATAIVAGPAGKLADRVGFRALVLPGAIVWAAGIAFFISQAGVRPDFAANWLPGILLTGIGMGMVIPNLNAAAVIANPGTGYGTAGAINSAARQLGAVLGVALLVVVLGPPEAAAQAGAFADGWRLAAIALLVTAAGAAGLRRRAVVDGAQELAVPVTASAIVPPVSGSGVVNRLTPASRVAARRASALVAGAPLLRGARPATIRRIANAATAVELRAGAWLFAAGDDADAFHVVVSGRLSVVEPDGQDGLIQIARGDVVGEVAVLAGTPRPMGVRAARDSRLLRIPAAELLELAETDTALARALVTGLGARLSGRATGASPAAVRPATIAVVPTSADVDAEPVAGALASALAHLAGVAQVDAPAGAAAFDHATIAEVLEDAESDHDHVLLCAHTCEPADAWTEFCLGQADRVVAVGSTGAAPGWGPAPGCELVWLGPRGGGLPSLAQRLGARAVVVSEPAGGDDPDVSALARRLAGASIGLVLSGGGARALAHIGVLEELEGAGVEIDRIAATGTGALIGAMHAAGMGADEIHAWCYEWLVRRRALAQFGRPRHGILREDRLGAMLDAAFAGLVVEELPRQLRCACADLFSREQVVLGSGPVAAAVRASLALPGMLAPVVREERVLVDGGMLDNLPLTALQAGEGPVIAVDVTALRPRLRTEDEPLPRITETLQRALLLGSTEAQAAARAAADVLIEPQIDDFGTLEYHLLEELCDAGRTAARIALMDTPGEQVLSLTGDAQHG